MKILATIAHFFDPQGDSYYGSTSPNAAPRAQALTRAIMALHQNFGKKQVKLLNRKKRIMTAVNTDDLCDVDVIVCTTGGKHLLGELALRKEYFTQRETKAEPLMLGFECHEVLRERLGDYDFQDPWFFAKLKWFCEAAGGDALLMPNRFELSETEPIPKLYIDGHVSDKFASEWQDINDQRGLKATVMGRMVGFERPTNPHSGCFFLNAAQMARWAGEPYFLDRDTGFAGPLESAATLGVMKTFRIYKPAPAFAGFLEILHANARYLGNWLKL